MMPRRNWEKPKFNLDKCVQCRFHGTGAGYPVGSRHLPIFCNYAGIKDKTCLCLIKGEVVDRRGDDPNNCQLFEKGKAPKTELHL